MKVWTEDDIKTGLEFYIGYTLFVIISISIDYSRFWIRSADGFECSYDVNLMNKNGATLEPIEIKTPTTGQRHNSGKIQLGLVPMHLLKPAAEVFQRALESGKYERWNWAKPGMKVSDTLESLKRHLSDFSRGIDLDPETGLSQVGHMMCNLIILTHILDKFPEYDDRPKEFFLY